jgi:DNA repair protein RecO (recombination protein O)
MSDRPRSFRTAAIVLKRRNIGEADRQVTILTPHFGKFDAVAKGVRKPASKKTGHVELFTKTDMLIAKGRSLDVISQAEMIEPFLKIREDLERGAYANYAAELLDRFTFESEATGTAILFALLDSCFKRLCSDSDPRRVIRYFELHLLDELGFRPELEECVVTHEDVQAIDQFFSYEDGGVVSPEGAIHTTGLAQLSMTTLKLLRHMQRSPYEQVASLKISDALHTDVERITLGYIRHILESRLQSVEFIRIIRQMN